MDAFASIISNNLNGVMKFLAAVTIVLSLPTMVASFYGMNVELPFEQLPHAFMVVIAISLLISLGAIFVFYKRDWF
jgi:magnesium transporter